MELKLRGLKQGRHEYSLSAPPARYGLESNTFPDELNFSVTIDVQGVNYYISVVAKTRMKCTCDRCLEEFFTLCNVQTNVIYTENASLDPEHRQEDLYFLPAGQDRADLTDDIRQNLLLGMDMKMLCTESCKGLCPHCGANLNETRCSCSAATIDTRWEALKKLL